MHAVKRGWILATRDRTVTLSGNLARRVARVEHVIDGRMMRRFEAAKQLVMRDLTKEQQTLIRDWFAREDRPVGAPCPARHLARDFCEHCIETVNPPALVRAMWVLVMAHMQDGSPAMLPAHVAQVYVDDPSAWPARQCEGCGYRLPTCAVLMPDRSFREIARYEGVCPSCGRSTRGEEEEDAT